MIKQKINMVGGGFQHDICSSAHNTPKLVEWVKGNHTAPISIHIGNAIWSKPINKSKRNYIETIRRVNITKVVTRDFLSDWWASIQNMFGSNLKVYEKMLDKAFKQIEDELVTREIDLEWFRYEITQLTNGAVVVSLYGESKE